MGASGSEGHGTGATWNGQFCVELEETGREQPESGEKKRKKKLSLLLPAKASLNSPFDFEFTDWVCWFGEAGTWELGCTKG